MNWIGFFIAIIISAVISFIVYKECWHYSSFIMTVIIAAIICFIILLYPTLSEPFNKYTDKQEAIEILATQENYDVYLDREKIEWKLLDQATYDKTVLSKDITIDTEHRAIHYFSDTEYQVKTLTKYENYELILENEPVELEDIKKLRHYRIFIDYENKKITLYDN